MYFFISAKVVKVKKSYPALFFIMVLLSFTGFSQISLKYIKEHEKAILVTSFSPDSKNIACLTADKTIKIYSTETGELISVLDDKGEGDVTISFSPDSKFLAAGSWDKTVKIWDLEKGKILRRLTGHTQATRSICFNYDGKLIATAGWDDIIKIWYAPTGINLKNFKGHNQCIRAISFSPDGNYIASGGYDLQLKVWDIATGNTVFSIKAAEFPIETICYSPNGKYIATAGLENAIKIWDAATGNLVKVLKGHTDAVFSLSFSPDGKYLASGGNDNIIKIWKIEQGLSIFDLKGHSLGIRSVEFSPNGKYLVSGAIDKKLRLWDVSSLNLEPQQKKTLSLSETENSELILWDQPSQNPSVSFSKYVTVVAEINDPSYKNIQFFLNKAEYSRFNNGNAEIVKPNSIKVNYNKGTEISYDVYLDNPENEIQIFAESSDRKLYVFSKPMNIRYFDISEQEKNCTLRALYINPKSYNDKKINSDFDKDNNEKLKEIIKTQEGKLFKEVLNIDLSDEKLLTKDQILANSDTAASLSKKNDLLFIFITGIFMKDSENKIYYLSPDANVKDLNNGLIKLTDLCNILLKTKCFKGIFVNASHHLSKYPDGFAGVEDQEIFDLLSRNIASDKVILILGKPENTQFFDVIANSFHPSNDTDNNNVIDLDEVITFINQLYKLPYQYKGRYLPLFMHSP